MEYFNNFSSLSELKLIYRRLAMLNHPDMGGNAEVMKKINIEFKQTKDKIENRSNSFNNLTIGNNVIINGSHSIIVSTTDTTFTAKSDYTNRMAEFSKETGICITNPKFKARIPKFINHAN
jgi:preprotein translocase subunit YajC